MKKPDMGLLTQEAEKIVSAIDDESINVYIFIRNEFKQEQGSLSPLFQFVYRSFYRLDNAGLTPQFKAEYFRHLERCRDCNNVDLSELTTKLYEYPNIKDQKSLQFSFATKLANTVNDTNPIYDSEIAKVFNFQPPYPYLTFEDRLSKLLKFYSELKSYYATLLDEDRCKDIFSCFYKQFPDYAHQIPKVKLLDFFFWSAGKQIKAYNKVAGLDR